MAIIIDRDIVKGKRNRGALPNFDWRPQITPLFLGKKGGGEFIFLAPAGGS